MAAQEPFVIVGGGLAGGEGRRDPPRGGVRRPASSSLAEEPEQPYERPPLSKEYLLGKADRARRRGCTSRAGTRRTTSTCGSAPGRSRLDAAAHRLTLESGETLPYAKLLLATGASPRRLPVPGADLDGVRYLRTLADSDRLLADLSGGGRRVVIVGRRLDRAGGRRRCPAPTATR